MIKLKENRLYIGFRKLLNDLKPMTFRQKVDHLWTYYKEYLWVAVFVLLMLSGSVVMLTSQAKEVLVCGMTVNVAMDNHGIDYLTQDYLAQLGGEEGKQSAELYYSNFSSLEDPTSSEDNYSAMTVLVARVSGGMLDYMILDKFAMEFYIIQDVYMDLREFFTPEELEALGDRVITARQEDETEAWAVAVDITDLPFVKDTITLKRPGDRVYFALSGNTQRPEMCRDVWEYINAWKSEE